MRIASEAARVAEEIPASSLKDARAVDEDVEMVEVGYDAIVIVNQTTSGVHGDLERC